MGLFDPGYQAEQNLIINVIIAVILVAVLVFWSLKSRKILLPLFITSALGNLYAYWYILNTYISRPGANIVYFIKNIWPYINLVILILLIIKIVKIGNAKNKNN